MHSLLRREEFCATLLLAVVLTLVAVVGDGGILDEVRLTTVHNISLDDVCY
jgi:hypothetical protein